MSEKTEKLLKELYDINREAAVLSSCGAVLHWDERTYMPRGGAENRANMISLISGMVHEKQTAPRIGEIINELLTDGINAEEDSIDAANVRELKRDYELSVKIPKSLVEEVDKAMTERFQGRDLSEQTLHLEMHNAVIEEILKKYPMRGLGNYLQATMQVDPTEVEGPAQESM